MRKLLAAAVAVMILSVPVSGVMASSPRTSAGYGAQDIGSRATYVPVCSFLALPQLATLPPAIALAYLRSLGWTGTLAQFFALSPAAQCAAITPGYSR